VGLEILILAWASRNNFDAEITGFETAQSRISGLESTAFSDGVFESIKWRMTIDQFDEFTIP
jgi:hypothetical protein